MYSLQQCPEAGKMAVKCGIVFDLVVYLPRGSQDEQLAYAQEECGVLSLFIHIVHDDSPFLTRHDVCHDIFSAVKCPIFLEFLPSNKTLRILFCMVINVCCVAVDAVGGAH